MTLPAKLYKYQPINNYSLRNLKNNQVFFNNPIDFNDPFDCAISLQIEPISEKDYCYIYDKFYSDSDDKKTIENKYITNGKLNDLFKQEVKTAAEKSLNARKIINLYNRGVCCFSEKKDDLLMWAHYADGHKGICLEFDTKDELFSKAIKVDYSDTIPHINLVEALFGSENEQFVKMIKTKYIDWSYECEWRIFHLEKKKLFGYSNNALTAIYFGPMTDFAYKEIIALILQGQNPNVRLFDVKMSQEKYAINFAEVKYTPYVNRNKKGNG